jgi:hypothetical protein
MLCKPETIAPHIHRYAVQTGDNRTAHPCALCDIPFILNIIATGCADPSYKCTTLWEARLAAIMHAPAAYRSLFVKILLRRYCSHHLQYGGEL